MKRLPAAAIFCLVALACAAPALAGARPPVLHFPLLHTLHRANPAHLDRTIAPSRGDVRPARAKTHKLPSWFTRRRMAIIVVRLA